MNDQMGKRVAAVIRRLAALEGRYEDLVWYARRGGPLRDGDPSMPSRVRIAMEQPEGVRNLCGEAGDWHHGFNSGCLAAFRLAIGLLAGEDKALDDFPSLDT